MGHVTPKITRPVLRYHGGKFQLGKWILAYFPAHRVYTEVYGGAASVLLRKPRCYAEVYNDLDDAMVNLFRILREPAAAKDLQNLLRLTPFARAEFRLAYQPCDDPLEQARRLVVRSFMGFGSAACHSEHRSGFRYDTTRSGSTAAHDWAHYPDALPAIVARLQRVVIENREALDVLRQHDAPECLHYVDPPYVHSTRTFKPRKSGPVYAHEMTDDDHRGMAAVLHDLTGMVIVSGYACPLYDELFGAWHRVSCAAHANGAQDRQECLWLNAAARRAQPAPPLFDFEPPLLESAGLEVAE